MSWLSGLAATAQAELARDLAHRRLGQAAQREAQEIELRRASSRTGNSSGRAPDRRRGEAPAPCGPAHAADIMAGGEAVGAEVAREAQQIGELHPLVAARRRGSACGPRAYSSAKRSITLSRKRLS